MLRRSKASITGTVDAWLIIYGLERILETSLIWNQTTPAALITPFDMGLIYHGVNTNMSNLGSDRYILVIHTFEERRLI